MTLAQFLIYFGAAVLALMSMTLIIVLPLLDYQHRRQIVKRIRATRRTVRILK